MIDRIYEEYQKVHQEKNLLKEKQKEIETKILILEEKETKKDA